MTTLSNKEIRKPIYAFVQNLVGRDLTVDEHNTLRGLIVTYSEKDAATVVELRTALHSQGGKMNRLKKNLHALLPKKGVVHSEFKAILEEILAILRQ